MRSPRSRFELGVPHRRLRAARLAARQRASFRRARRRVERATTSADRVAARGVDAQRRRIRRCTAISRRRRRLGRRLARRAAAQRARRDVERIAAGARAGRRGAGRSARRRARRRRRAGRSDASYLRDDASAIDSVRVADLGGSVTAPVDRRPTSRRRAGDNSAASRRPIRRARDRSSSLAPPDGKGSSSSPRSRSADGR